jgi:small subunit ribosomal protein S8
MNYAVCNMVANIKNGQLAKKSYIKQPKTKICEALLNILWNEGFILGYRVSKINTNILKIFLKYKNGKPAINNMQMITQPSLRVYYSIKQIWKFDSSKGIIILSTNKGFMSINTCKKLKIGGEPFIVLK